MSHQSVTDLLCACARARLTPRDARQLRDSADPAVDWPAFVQRAEWHGLVPLASKHLGSTCADLVPAEVMADLRARAARHAWWSLSLAGELLGVLTSLDEAGIPAVPFKGPVLAVSAYGDLSLRQFGDLDILVCARDVPRARERLLDRGYRPDLALTDAEERAVIAYGCELVLRRGAVPVELHWRLAPDYFSCAMPLDGVFDRLTTMRIGRRRVAAMSGGDLLLALCIHGAKDCWQRLLWIADIAEVLRTEPVDWADLFCAADAIGARRLLLTGLLLARTILAAELPPDVVSRVDADWVAAALVAGVRSRLLDGPLRVMRGAEEVAFHLRSRERLHDRARYCVRLALTPTIDDWRFAGPSGGVLRRVARPIRLLAKYAAQAIGPRRAASLAISRGTAGQP